MRACASNIIWLTFLFHCLVSVLFGPNHEFLPPEGLSSNHPSQCKQMKSMKLSISLTKLCPHDTCFLRVHETQVLFRINFTIGPYSLIEVLF